MINKKRALFFLCANAALLIIKIGLFFYTDAHIFLDFSHPPRTLNSPTWVTCNIVILALMLSINAGVYWIFKLFNEKAFIRIGVILFACFYFAMTVLNFLLEFKIIQLTAAYPPIIAIFFLPIVVFFAISLLFVKNKAIKKYIRLFDLFFLLLLIIPAVGPNLYDSFLQTKWFLINRDFLAFFPYTVLLVLFVEIYNMAGRAPVAIDEATQDVEEV